MVCLAGIVDNNPLSYAHTHTHTHTKVSRALRRKSSAFLEKVVVRNAKPLFLKSNSGRIFPVFHGTRDNQRLRICFEQIGYGLYFHENKKSFSGKIQALLGFVTYEDENLNLLVKYLKRRFEVDPNVSKPKGENIKVFQYEYEKKAIDNLFAYKLTFYEGAHVFLAFIPTEDTPCMDLMQRGLPTTIELGDRI